MILHGDAARIPLRDNSVELVLTDPPYGLGDIKDLPGLLTAWISGDDPTEHVGKGGFMSKGWDRICPPPSLWREVYRVLKPGGHLLCFAGTRTADLIGISIRLAGFELRDEFSVHGIRVDFLYGSGFPKSTSIGKSLDARAVVDWLRDKPHGLTAKQIRKVVSAAVSGEFLAGQKGRTQTGSIGENMGFKSTPNTEGACLIAELEERFGEMPKRVKVGEAEAFGREGRSYGAKMKGWEPIKVDPMLPITAPATPEAAEWEGFGTGLKPAHELVLVFRKPLEKGLTVAENCLKWGTGALNVDAGRIGCINKTKFPEGDYGVRGQIGVFKKASHIRLGDPNPSGRFPPNVILVHDPACQRVGVKRVKGQTGRPNCYGKQYKTNTYGDGKCGMKNLADPDGLETVPQYACSPECPVAELDRQSGVSKGTDRVRHNRQSLTSGKGIYGKYNDLNGSGYPDTGTASRFFKQVEYGEPDFIYCAKESKAMRNAGLSGEEKTINDGRSIPIDNPYQRGLTPKINAHPTVKPVSLLAYLIRMFSRPGDMVLDPFAGSGSTLVACRLEDRNCIGMDNEWEYVVIGDVRDTYWANPEVQKAYLLDGELPVQRVELPLFGEE